MLSAAVFSSTRGRGGAWDGCDVGSACEDPGERGLCWCGADLLTDRADLIDDREVAPEVLARESRVGLAPVVVSEVIDCSDLAGE